MDKTARNGVDGFCDRLQRQLAVSAVQPDELGAGIEFWRAAFMFVDVTVGVAQNRAMGRRQGGQRQGIGGGAGGDGEYGDLAFEQAVLSPMAREFWADNKRIDNDRIRTELGVTLAYPTYREGLDAIFAGK